MSSELPPSTVYLHYDGQQLGPYSLATAREMVAAGSVPHDVPAWGEGMPAWVPLSELLPPDASSPVLAIASEPAEQGAEASFLGSLPWAFVYPFQQDGLILLGSGAVFFWLLGLIGMLRGRVGLYGGLMSVVLAIFAAGYLAAYVQSIIQSAARGDEEMPSWPDFTDLHEDILQPGLRMGATGLVCLGPGLGLLAWGASSGSWGDAVVPGWVAWALLAVGL